jgi:hypothetical protein
VQKVDAPPRSPSDDRTAHAASPSDDRTSSPAPASAALGELVRTRTRFAGPALGAL